MESYQHLKILQNLYRLKILGYKYHDPLEMKTSCSNQQLAHDLVGLSQQVQSCCLCDFNKSRTQSMFGYGSLKADVMFIDFMVSEIQDTTQKYYVGRTGEMLQNMIEKVLELSIENVFITHAIKCKPLSFKSTFEEELKTCQSYLFSQINFIQPKVIVALGKEVYNIFAPSANNFEKVRGHIISFEDKKLIPIYHPSFLLRNPNYKKIVFNDLKTIKSCL